MQIEEYNKTNMKISLLISNQLTNKIQKIKSDLYSKGVRYDGKLDIGIPHIKLAEASDLDENSKKKIIKDINDVFLKYKSNKIKNFKLVNEPREQFNWIAIQIHEDWLLDLSKEIEDLLESKDINQTREYKMKIYKLRKEDHPDQDIKLDECIADHLNLVNKCKKEMADIAGKEFSFINKISEIEVGELLFEND